MSLSKKVKKKNRLLNALEHADAKHSVIVQSFTENDALLSRLKNAPDVHLSLTPKLLKKIKVKKKDLQTSMQGTTYLASSSGSLKDFCQLLEGSTQNVLALQSREAGLSSSSVLHSKTSNVQDLPQATAKSEKHTNVLAKPVMFLPAEVEALVRLLGRQNEKDIASNLHSTLKRPLYIDHFTLFYMCKIYGIVHGRIMGVEPMFSESQSDTLTS